MEWHCQKRDIFWVEIEMEKNEIKEKNFFFAELKSRKKSKQEN